MTLFAYSFYFCFGLRRWLPFEYHLVMPWIDMTCLIFLLIMACSVFLSVTGPRKFRFRAVEDLSKKEGLSWCSSLYIRSSFFTAFLINFIELKRVFGRLKIPSR